MQVMQESLQDHLLADTYQDLPELKYVCSLYYLFVMLTYHSLVLQGLTAGALDHPEITSAFLNGLTC
jgi:hypothetical protein